MCFVRKINLIFLKTLPLSFSLSLLRNLFGRDREARFGGGRSLHKPEKQSRQTTAAVRERHSAAGQ